MNIGKLYKSNEKTFNVKDIPGAPETDATITIRLLTPGERRKVSNKAITPILDDNFEYTGKVNTDWQAIAPETFVRCVVGWSGFFGDGGVELHCTNENKALLVDLFPEIADFVQVEHQKMVDEFEEANKAEVKN